MTTELMSIPTVYIVMRREPLAGDEVIGVWSTFTAAVAHTVRAQAEAVASGDTFSRYVASPWEVSSYDTL